MREHTLQSEIAIESNGKFLHELQKHFHSSKNISEVMLSSKVSPPQHALHLLITEFLPGRH